MSTNNEKNKIIKNLLISFKKNELHLINFIVFKFKNYKDGDDLYNKTRTGLLHIGDLKNLSKILDSLLNSLDIIKLRLLNADKNIIYNHFISINKLIEITKNKRLLNLVKSLHELKSINCSNIFFSNEKDFYFPELHLNDILNFQRIIILNDNKNEILEEIEYQYSNLIKNNKNLDKYIKNTDFLDWAINYLDKKPDFSYKYSITNPDEYKDTIYKYFDRIFIENFLKYEREINIIKKAWQQKQFRDQGKTKKEYHLPLTKQAKNKLSDLAKFNNLSENSMLEKLIHQTYLIEMCDEKEKPKF